MSSYQNKVEEEASQLVPLGSYYMCQDCYEEMPDYVARAHSFASQQKSSARRLSPAEDVRSPNSPEKMVSRCACKIAVQVNPEDPQVIISPDNLRIMEAKIYMHVPPKAGGEIVDEELCEGCLKSGEVDEANRVIHLCQHGISENGSVMMPTFDQVQMNVEMILAQKSD